MVVCDEHGRSGYQVVNGAGCSRCRAGCAGDYAAGPGICSRTAGCSAVRVPGSRAARADRAAFSDELGTHARRRSAGEYLRRCRRQSRAELVVLARKAQAFPLMPKVLRAWSRVWMLKGVR
jgi:hypothetical protein